MRFACQSCGKAYNLPEERIAEKSNVKLKCRVCGAIVEVKKHGDLVARILDDGENKHGRVSEAPAPLTSMLPDDGDDATAAIAFGDHILGERMPGEVEIRDSSGADPAGLGWAGQSAEKGPRPLPPVPAIPPLPAPPPAGFGVTPVPPPLSQRDGSVAFGRPLAEPGSPPPLSSPQGEPAAPPLPGVAFAPSGMQPAAPPPLSGGRPADFGVRNGSSNGAVAGVDSAFLSSPPGSDLVGAAASMSATSSSMADAPRDTARRDDTTMKMLAAFVTGLLLGYILTRLLF